MIQRSGELRIIMSEKLTFSNAIYHSWMDRIFNKFKETPPHSICLSYRMTKIESTRIEYQVDVDKSVPWHRSSVVS